MRTQTTTDAALRAQLDERARTQRRDVCGRCAGSATRPCPRCSHQRRRAIALRDAGRPVIAIAAAVGLPRWRVEQLLDERSADADERSRELERRAELLRAELGGLVDVILAGPRPEPGAGWQFDQPRHWHLWVRLSLELAGWNMRSVRSVLEGTHIPNRTLRARVEEVKRRHDAVTGEPLTSSLLAARAGLTNGGRDGDGTYFDRLIGSRPVAAYDKAGRLRGGTLLTAIRLDHAARIARAIGIAPYEIPGL